MVVVALMLLSQSCVDNLDYFVPLEIVEKGDVENVFKALEADPQTGLLACEQGGVLVFSDVVLKIPDHAFQRVDGTACNGEVTIEVYEVFDRSDIIKHNIPTISESDLLETYGSFFLSAKAGEDELILMDGKEISIYVNNSDVPQDVELYYGLLDGARFLWKDADGQIGLPGDIEVTEWEVEDGTDIISGFGYKFETDQLGWLGCKRLNTSEPKTEVCVELPEGFTPKNSKVFVSFDGGLMVAALEDFTENSGFCTSLEGLPIEYEVTFVVLSEIEGRYYIDRRNAIINPNLTVSLTPAGKPITEIEEILDNL
jgi:hypothetical protein